MWLKVVLPFVGWDTMDMMKKRRSPNGIIVERKITFCRDKVNNVDMLGLEFAQNITYVNAAWNKGTTRWLKKCTWKRDL
jgi:hypothetical protein